LARLRLRMQVGGEVIAEAVLRTGPRQCRGSREATLPMVMTSLLYNTQKKPTQINFNVIFEK
jgi:hypothetical protein